MNSRRFLSLDLNYGHRVDSEMYEYLIDNGDEPRRSTTSSSATRCKPALHPGQRLLHDQRAPGGRRRRPAPSGEVFGYSEITRQYYNRYRLPVMHTETNIARGAERRRGGELALEGMGQRAAGCATTASRSVGFTWYSLTDQMDWDTGAAPARTPARQSASASTTSTATSARSGAAYKQLIADWRRHAAGSERLPGGADRNAHRPRRALGRRRLPAATPCALLA